MEVQVPAAGETRVCAYHVGACVSVWSLTAVEQDQWASRIRGLEARYQSVHKSWSGAGEVRWSWFGYWRVCKVQASNWGDCEVWGQLRPVCWGSWRRGSKDQLVGGPGCLRPVMEGLTVHMCLCKGLYQPLEGPGAPVSRCQHLGRPRTQGQLQHRLSVAGCWWDP